MTKKQEPWQEIIQKKLKLEIVPKEVTSKDVPNETLKETHKEITPNIKSNIKYNIKLLFNSYGTITIKPSNKQLSQILCNVKNAIYDVKKNEWRVSVEGFLSVRKALQSNKFVFEDLPKGLLNLLKTKINSNNFNLNGEIYQKMFKFQRDGVVFGLNRGGRVLFVDDMGLGKTVQALGVAYYYKVEWPLLIISPASLLDSWADAIHTFLNETATIVRNKSEFGSKISIVSYEMASKNVEMLKMAKFNVIICDEIHYLKSTVSQRSKRLIPILQESSRLILISGTPAVSRPVELYNIFLALDKTIFPNFMQYGKRYCNARKVGHWYDYKGCTNADELNYILKEYFMIRRKKEEVLSQLPVKTRKQIVLSTFNSNKTLTEEIVGEKVEQTIMAKYAEAAKIKVESVKGYLETLIETDLKFIVFAHHNFMISSLSDFLKEKNIKFICIDGNIPGSTRHKLVNEFQDNSEVRIALLSITACSTGLTLTSAKAVVFAELYWNPGTLLQAEDRIHRIGQKDSVVIHYLVAGGTIDEYVWPILLKKLNVLQSLGIQENTLKKVGTEDKKQKGIDEYFK